ncbi:MAG: GspE/PulE family protein [Microthrixaceae bacterium]
MPSFRRPRSQNTDHPDAPPSGDGVEVVADASTEGASSNPATDNLPAERAPLPALTDGATSFDEDHLDEQLERWTRIARPKLGDVLLSLGSVDADGLLDALQRQREAPQDGEARARLGEILLELGSITDDALAKGLADQFGIPLADLSTDDVDRDAVARVPEELARRYRVLPLRVAEDDRVIFVSGDPLDTDAIRDLTAACHRITLMIGPRGHIDRLIDRAYDALSGADDMIRAFQITAHAVDADAGDGFRLDESAPVIRVVNQILTQGVRSRASDIHVQPGHGDIRVRYRVDGAMTDAIRLPASMGPAVTSRLKVMAELNIVERRKPQDGQFTITVDSRPIDVRLSVVPTVDGEKSVMRLLDKSASLISMDQLGMPPTIAQPFLDMVRSPLGMVLCTGPTGSGKTTSLYAALSEVNDPSKTVVTIEDPVEYSFDGIAQMQVSDTGMDFAEGLRGILRQDPDVILVGEIRDAETARIAMQAALTGHLVLSSLHAIDSVSAVHRFIGMGIEPFLVSSAINGVVAQRLLRRLCPSCRLEVNPSPNELRVVAEVTDGLLPTAWYRPRGCNLCAGTGYRDRQGVYELLRFTDTVRDLVADRASPTELREAALADGMRTMQQQAFLLVVDGVTTVEEVMRCVYAPMASEGTRGPAALPEGRRAIDRAPEDVHA